MAERTDETGLLVRAGSPGSRQRILADLFTQHRDRLRCMVQLRMDRKLKVRVDPSDILQEAFMEASRRVEEYCRDATLPVFLWIRGIAAQRLVDHYRRHVGSLKRNPAREISLDQPWGPPSQSGTIAENLMGKELSPSQAAMQAEAKARLEMALDRMDEVDREIVALRHFERLSSREAGEVIGMRPEAVRQRYLRAIGKLRSILLQMPGTEEDLKP
jgi:RNA polymerase sigma-70 factor, ECF subfamily